MQLLLVMCVVYGEWCACRAFPFPLCPFLRMIRAALLQTGTGLNSVHAFGNRRPLICGADGQRCPSLPSVCSQIDAWAAATADGKHRREAVVRLRLGAASWRPLMCILQCERGMYIPEASLCKGDLHGTVGRGGWFQDRPLWAAPGDLRFLCEMHWPSYPQSSPTHPHTSQSALTLPVFPLLGVWPADCPRAFVPLCVGFGFASSLTFVAAIEGGWIGTAASNHCWNISWIACFQPDASLIYNNPEINTYSGPVQDSGPYNQCCHLLPWALDLLHTSLFWHCVKLVNSATTAPSLCLRSCASRIDFYDAGREFLMHIMRRGQRSKSDTVRATPPLHKLIIQANRQAAIQSSLCLHLHCSLALWAVVRD